MLSGEAVLVQVEHMLDHQLVLVVEVVYMVQVEAVLVVV